MPRQKHLFYIIGHNPNTIEEAREYLQKGANALEPDIVHAEGRFYVSHIPQPSYENVPTVQDYLRELKALLLDEQYNLALVIWDIKDTDFDPNEFIAIVKDNFSGEPCDGVVMLMTNANDHNFLNRYKGTYSNVGVGVDESDVSPYQLEKIFKSSGQQNFSYADGITTFLNKPGVFKNITEAQRCRNQHEPGSFGLIYTWVLSKKASMRRYLDTYIDGIMVDTGAVKRLKKLITTEPYNKVYQLAQNGHNPFAIAPIPKYLLTVKTSDQFLAGTDARFLFTLTNTSGNSLTSLPYNRNTDGALERGSTTFITLEGMDLGEIKSLSVEALTDGIAAGWLPERISVESKLMDKVLNFDFNEGNERITKKGGVVVKLSSP
ncbi:MAG: phospholipase SdSicTox-betaIIB1bxii-like [Ferruginibacter sp.]|nr:phospholipase SdSicTox-betaIIB1bxii-like [Ferruginibacter sp.]